MKVNVKDRVMKCYMCGKWTRLNDTGLCQDCLSQKEAPKVAPDQPESLSVKIEV